MFQKIIQIFKIKDLRNKILFVLGIFVIFRVMANIPVSGVDIENLNKFFGQFQIFGFLNLFTGGALDKLSIVMLGLAPYITATIILQLLTMIFPVLERLYKEEGDAGRQKINQYGRILTVPLAMIQGCGMLILLQRENVIEPLSFFFFLTAILTITAGTMFLMWLGELISEKGIGNGVSLLIFAGIVADFPINIQQAYNDLSLNPTKIPSYLLFFGLSLLIIASVVLINEARRNIPISYTKRVRGMRLYGGVSTFLPMNINPAGVIPIIFALSVLLFPGMIANFLINVGGITGNIAKIVANFFDPQKNFFGYNAFYFILIVLFTFFYTAVTFNPKTISSNLQKSGAFIPGIRPGSSTTDFISYVLNRILPIGALFLGLIAIFPSIIGSITNVMVFQFLIGGTSLLIVVSVVLDTIRQIKAQLQIREYDTF